MSVESLVEPYDSCSLECDGLTRTLHLLLDANGIRHRVMGGAIYNHNDETAFSPHFWIELSNGDLIDFRARMWLGDQDDVPHGVFSLDDYPNMEYDGDDETRSFDGMPESIVVQMAIMSCPDFDPDDFELEFDD